MTREDVQHLSTKQDLSELRLEMTQQEHRQTLRLGAMIVASTGILFAAIRLL